MIDAQKPSGIIYCTTNLVNGKKYIGQDSKNDSNYLGSGMLLHLAINKYGIENFVKENLQDCFGQKDLEESERYWIDYFGAVKSDLFYNISSGGTGGNLGPEVSKKMSVGQFKRIQQNNNWKGFESGVGSKPYADRISKAKKGKSWTKIQREAILTARSSPDHINGNSKQVIQLRADNKEIIRIWPSALAVVKELYPKSSQDRIANVCRKNKVGKKQKPPKQFLWFFLDHYKSLNPNVNL